MPRRFLLLMLALSSSPPVAAQTPPELARERAEYAAWLRTGPTSPFAALALQRVGPGITLGPAGSDVLLERVPQVRVSASGGRVMFDSAGAARVLPWNRVVPFGPYRLLATGTAARATLMVFGPPRDARSPAYFPWLPAGVDTVDLVPPAKSGSVMLLAPEGAELEAGEAGSVTVERFGAAAVLRVRRFPGGTDDETELEIYFRDGSSGQGSYPAGRFVSLQPLGNGKYVLDFNRARNPFCAYSSVFPCPAPWAGNTITARIEAGEMYGKDQ